MGGHEQPELKPGDHGRSRPTPDGAFFSFAELTVAPTPELLYQMLVERIPAMVYVSAPDDPGDVRYVSPQVRDQLGFEPEEWLAERYFWKTRLHPDDREWVLRSNADSGHSGGFFEMQYRMYHRDGHFVWLSDQGMQIFHEDGTVLCWLGFTFDISEQKQVEEALREAEERYRTLVEQIPAVIFTVKSDQIHHPSYLSPQVEPLFGYTREEWAADPEFWLKLVHPDDLEEALAKVHGTDSNGEMFSHEYRMIARDGSIVWVQNDASPVCDAGGNPVFWQGVLVDITDRKLAEQALREAESRYRTLVEQISVVTYIEPLDNKGMPSYVSPQIEELLGYSLNEWQANPDLGAKSIHPDDLALWEAEIERTDRTGEHFDLIHRMIAADGHTVWVHSSSRLVVAEDGKPQFWQGTMRDITDAVLADQKLAESEQRYRSLFDNNPDPVYSFDLNGHLISANRALSELNGFAIDEMLGMHFRDLVIPEDVERVSEHFERAAGGQSQDYECSALRKDGSGVEIHVTNLPIVVGGEIVGVYGVAKDISERKNLERQLKHMAFHDPLTDLPNRLLFMDRLEQALAAIPRRSPLIAVLFVDLDDFKSINDNFGHDAGDQVLKQAATLIQSCVRAGDTTSRLGGDEFTLLLQDVEKLDDALDVANRILERFRQPLPVEGHEVWLTVSIGVVLSSSPGDDPEALIRRGDQAMYRAKAAGKSRYAVYTSHQERNTEVAAPR